MLDESISALIGDIYAGTQDYALWEETMRSIGARLEARFLLVATVDFRRGLQPSTNWYGADDTRFARGVEEYGAEMHRIDPTIPYTAAHSRGTFDSLTAIAPADYLRHPYVSWNRDMLRTTFWQAFFCRPSKDLCFGISLHRSEDIGPMVDDDARLAQMLFAHMEQATRLAAQPLDLESAEPLILLDANGSVIRANDAARRVLAAKDGLTIFDRQLRATDRRNSARLHAAITSALAARTEGGAGGGVALDRQDRPALLLSITPMPATPPPLSAIKPAVLVRIIDPEAAPPPQAAHWKALFGFTPAETRLAEALLAGEGNLRNTAETLGISYGTARVHLASIFTKASVSSQSQLARLLTRVG